MFEDEMHEMRLLKHGDDTEEWLCAECGRHMILKYGERVERIIKTPGDEQVRHYGGQFGISMKAALMSDEPDATSNDGGPALH